MKKIYYIIVFIMSMFTFSLANAGVTPDKTYTDAIITDSLDSFGFVAGTNLNNKYYQINVTGDTQYGEITLDFGGYLDRYQCPLGDDYYVEIQVKGGSSGITSVEFYDGFAYSPCTLVEGDGVIIGNVTFEIFATGSGETGTVNITTVDDTPPPTPSAGNPLVNMVDNSASGSINGAQDIMSSDLGYIIYFIIAILIISLVVGVIMYWVKKSN